MLSLACGQGCPDVHPDPGVIQPARIPGFPEGIDHGVAKRKIRGRDWQRLAEIGPDVPVGVVVEQLVLAAEPGTLFLAELLGLGPG